VARRSNDAELEFDQVAALTSELEMLRLQSAEIESTSQKKVRQLERELESTLQKLRAISGANVVDPVEHQAMRQELEALRRTVKDLQQELEEANHQSQQGEDALEDKNDQIERLSQEVDMLRGDMEEAEYKRREADEAKKQLEKGLYQLQEEMDRIAASKESMQMAQTENGGGAWQLLIGILLGVLFLLGGLETYSFTLGKGELIALLQAGPSVAKQDAVAEKTVPAQPAEKTPEKAVEPEVVVFVPPAQETAEQQSPALIQDKSADAGRVAAVEPVKQEPSPVVSQEQARVEEEPKAEKTPPETAPVVEDAAKQVEHQVVLDEKTGHTMIGFQGGRFTMGNRSGVSADEAPAHEVILKPFLIGRDEVSFREYDNFARATGRSLPKDEGWGRDGRPVINVSWEDAQAYVDWLSVRSGLRYRLPSEAEWEYAAGGGSEAFYWWGYQKGVNNANCFNCGSEWDGRSTAPAGSFKPNPYGLHDTAGNVQEWVRDCYKGSYLNAPTDGSAVDFSGCGERVARGGAYNKPAASMRSTKRSRFVKNTLIPSLGFRIAREP